VLVGKRGRERMDGRKEKGRRKIGGPTGGKMVISPVGLTPLARNPSKMAYR
jgi:hypothetical protein